jgi:hypothetical protein
VLAYAKQLNFIDEDHSPKRSREREEIEEKLNILGLPIPWKTWK